MLLAGGPDRSRTNPTVDGVLTEVHLAHAALTERFQDLVMTEGFPDHDVGYLPEGTRQDCSRKAGAAYRGEENGGGADVTESLKLSPRLS